MASRLPGAIESNPTQDIHVTIFVKAFPVARERFKTVLIFTDDPGVKDTRKVYSLATALDDDFNVETATYRAFVKAMAQEPKPEKILVYSITRTAGEPVTDWSTGLNDYVNANGVDFYYFMCTTRKPAEVVELTNTAVTYEIMFFGANYPGDQATIATSTGGTELIWTRRRFGTKGNGDRIKLTTNSLDSATSTTVAKVANGLNWDYTVSLKNNGSAITATLNDIIAAVNADAAITPFIKVKLGAGATGTTTAVAQESFVVFAGGGANAECTDTDGSDVTATRTRGETINHRRVSFWVHTDSEEYWPEAVVIGLMSPKEAGAGTFKNQHPIGVPNPGYTLNALQLIREAALNTFFIDFNGRLSTSDGWTTEITYIDVQMKVDVLTFLQRRALWDLISPPPRGLGITYDDPGIGQIINRIVGTLREGATRRRSFIATLGGKAMAEVLFDDFRTISQGLGQYTSKEDWENRIFRCEWQATILHFVHEIFVTGYLVTDFIEPALPQ